MTETMASQELAQSVLDAVTAHIAVVDSTGGIVATNAAWRAFAQHNGHPPEALVGVGANYLSACRAAEVRDDVDAAVARKGIESVLKGEQALFVFEYPCHSPQLQRWFSMRVTSLPAGQSVVISHEEITVRRLAEDALRRSHEMLEERVRERTMELERSNEQLRLSAKAFDNTVEAVVITDAQRNVVAVNGAFTRITGYDGDEVMGSNPRCYGSDRHGHEFFQSLRAALDATGCWQGEIWNRRKNGEIYPAWESISASRDAGGRITHYVGVFSDISQIKRAEERLAFLAHHDPLTGLGNRLLFIDRMDQAIERARRHASPLALMFIDMDNFKLVNDSLGHEVGDRYLKTIGERLRTHLRAEDTVARLGGDEFAVLVSDFADAAAVARLAEALVHQLALGMRIAGHDVASSASIGISLFPDDADSGDALMKAADAAMYLAKTEGRNTARFFRAELTERAHRRMAMEGSLRQAVARQELLLHYQPLVDLGTGECVGLEALVRWDSAEHGLLLPDAFIPLAEETRLIQPIGQWVLERALQDLAGWRAEGLGPLHIAINVSWRQFNDERFVDCLAAALDAHGVPAQDLNLDLEVTESVLQSSAQAVRELERARKSGVHVLIDDFGTGHSSLSQLMRMPVDGLKIDRMFVQEAAQDPRSRAIIRSVIALAQGLKLELVAEGVETPDQAALLRELGCRYGQGYLFSAPVPAAEVPTVVAALARAAAAAPVR